MLVETRRQRLMDEYRIRYIKSFGIPPGPNAIREIEMQMNCLLSGTEYQWIECGKQIKIRLLVRKQIHE